MPAVTQQLAELKAAGLYRGPVTLTGRKGHRAWLGDKPVVLFCSNDYLGLSQHPDLVLAAQQAAQEWGCGSGAAHLISGHVASHQALEEAFADFMGYEAALLCSTGYMANLAVMTAFSGRHDTVLQDRLNHASLLDGCRLSGAKLQRYRHANADVAGELAEKNKPVMLASDAVFSMDGDVAPLSALASVAKANRARLFADDAHGFGVLGPQGRGTAASLGLSAQQVDLQLCTLGKAAGVFGAVIVGRRDDIAWCVNKARSYIYTTALPPMIAAAGLCSLRLIQKADDRRERLADNIRLFRTSAEQLGLPLMPSETAIQPIVLPGNHRVVAAAKQLLQAGFLVTAIRSPTVPVGQERLRVVLSSEHSNRQIGQLLEALEKIDVNQIT